jgi:hypothetical protein
MFLINPYSFGGGSGPAPLGAWDFDDYTDIAAMTAAGWQFESGHDWTLVDDGGSKSLTGTTGYVATPPVRADSSGAKTLRLKCDIKVPNLTTQLQFLQFKDGGSGESANCYLNSVEKISVRRWNGNATQVLLSTNGYTVGSYDALEIMMTIDATAGAVEMLKNGAANGSATSIDTNDGTCPGLNYVRFYGFSGGWHFRNPALWAS